MQNQEKRKEGKEKMTNNAKPENSESKMKSKRNEKKKEQKLKRINKQTNKQASKQAINLTKSTVKIKQVGEKKKGKRNNASEGESNSCLSPSPLDWSQVLAPARLTEALCFCGPASLLNASERDAE